MASVFERYRPREWAGVVGQDAAVRLLRRILTNGAGGRALWFAGPSGSGKTTLARIVAAEFAEPWSVCEIDAQDCTLDYLRNIERECQYRAMGAKHGKVWIVNEAHGLRGPVLSRFLTLIEQLPEHALLIFTTTNAGQQSLFEDFDDATPLMSRCVRVPIATHTGAAATPSDLTHALAKRAKAIAEAEQLDGKPVERYLRLALECRHNFRLMLSRIDAGELLD